MSKEVKKSNSTQKQSTPIEITFMNAVVEKGGEILKEFSLKDGELNLMLDTNSIDKDGNRFDPKTGKLLGVKGKITISDKMKKG